MKLRNRKTGEIIETVIVDHGAEWEMRNACANEDTRTYNSLAELEREWEDVPEEPNYFYCISIDSSINKYEVERYAHESWCKNGAKIIGNYFETKEEAEQAVEKLKAWKRLKDKGFRFDGWEDLQAEMSIDDLMLFNRDVLNTDNIIGFRMNDYHDCIKDLNICFGGEE